MPGVSVTVRNTLNAFQAEEIDVAFWNEGEPGGLRMFDHILLVECKNWSAPAGYPELAVFNDKLASRGRPMGIFVAAAGITGNAAGLTAAHEVLSRALGQGREIIVLTPAGDRGSWGYRRSRTPAETKAGTAGGLRDDLEQ